MNGLIIKDKAINKLNHIPFPLKCLNFDLIDLLTIIEKQTKKSEWDICINDGTGEIFIGNEIDIINQKKRICGTELIQLASKIVQIIDGKFLGIFKNQKDYWIRIAAIDSSFWVIQCEDKAILNLFKKKFKDVIEIDEEPITL